MNKQPKHLPWRFKTPQGTTGLSPEDRSQLAQKLQVSPLLVQLMNLRGLDNLENMQRFLSPGLRYLPPLKKWPNIEQGAQCILEAVTNNEKIAVWGDYDVDGITAAALVKDFFAQKGIFVEHHIPDRLEWGYGLNIQKIQSMATEGVGLLLTVDCGIANIDEIQKAKELGMKVVLTDHHLPGPHLPNADVIINPKLQSWPSPNLAGVGVAFLLMGALNRILPGPTIDIRQYLDLVALGTIADVVPLDEQNRILVKNGLLVLSQGSRVGIQALKQVSGINHKETVGSTAIGFCLAPRINAAGRIGDPNLAVKLLLEKNTSKAQQIAHELNQLNVQRKDEENRILNEALIQAEEQNKRPGLVLHAEHWHSGIIGIVASRIAEKYHRPCIILTKEKGIFKGSGRAPGAFNLYQALEACQKHLYRFGGHKQAAGLKLEPFQLSKFKKTFDQAIQKQLESMPLGPPLELDLKLPFAQVTPDLITELNLLQPYGPGNPRPTFLAPQVKILKHRFFAQKQHLELHLCDLSDGTTMRAVAWRQGQQWQDTKLENKIISVTYFPRISKYHRAPQTELTIQDIFIHDPGFFNGSNYNIQENV